MLLPVTRAGRVHALLDATLGHEVVLELLEIRVDHGVQLIAEGEAGVGKLLSRPLVGERQVVVGLVVSSRILQHAVVASRVTVFPYCVSMVVQEILVVFQQFPYACPRHVDQL